MLLEDELEAGLHMESTAAGWRGNKQAIGGQK
jgi:hypothetical protein